MKVKTNCGASRNRTYNVFKKELTNFLETHQTNETEIHETHKLFVTMARQDSSLHRLAVTHMIREYGRIMRLMMGNVFRNER